VAERSGVVKQVGEIGSQDVTAGVATRVQLLIGSDDGAPNYSLKRFVMGDGGGMPRHTNRIEHVQFVLGGRARVGIGDRVHEVGPESVLYIPAGVPHSYDVVEAPFEFLCIVPNAEDRIEILDDAEPR